MRKEKRKEITITVVFFVLDRLIKGLTHSFNISQLNKGISLGVFQGTSIIVTLLVPVLVFFFLIIFRNKLNFFGLCLVLGGGFSNFVDRVFFSGVIDYLNFFSLIFFNLADLMISLGLLLILVDLMRKKRLS